MSVDDKYRKSTAASIPNFRISAPVTSQFMLNRKVNLSPDEKYRQKTLRQQLRAIAHSAGFSEYAFHAYALTINRHFGSSLGVSEMQKTATFARRTFERYFDARRALYELHQIPHW